MSDTISNTSPPTMHAIDSNAASISAKIMVISMIILFFILAFCFFLSLYAKWYWSRHEDPTIVYWRRSALRQGAQTPAGARRSKGLDRATLRSLPVLVYDPKDFGEELLECSVCLSEVSKGENVRLLPKCNHGFHVECIDMWFKSHSTCPLCRNSVVVSSTTDDQVESRAAADAAAAARDSPGSSSDSDSEHEDDGGSHHPRVHVVDSRELPSIPANVLYFGNEVQVRSLGENINGSAVTSTSTSTSTSASASASTSSSSSGVTTATTRRDELVIEIPRDLRDLCDDCATTPPSSRGGFVEEGAKTPVVSRLRSLKRLLSRGKIVAPWTSSSGSTSNDIESN
ncbi:hypothetical protein vseg_020689 [Gypsophila vaccaria]